MLITGTTGNFTCWWVYILKCSDGTLYTGVTNYPEKRLAAHQSGKASKYTRSRLPVRMIYLMSGFSRSGALVEEARIKKLTRLEKLKLQAFTVTTYV
jgi:putative endonuclease